MKIHWGWLLISSWPNLGRQKLSGYVCLFSFWTKVELPNPNWICLCFFSEQKLSFWLEIVPLFVFFSLEQKWSFWWEIVPNMFFAALCIWFCEGIPKSKGRDTRQACISASITNCRLLCGHFINCVYVPTWAFQNLPHNSGRYFPIHSVSNLLVWKLAQSLNLSKEHQGFSDADDLVHGIPKTHKI